jgi:hypothetical protein
VTADLDPVDPRRLTRRQYKAQLRQPWPRGHSRTLAGTARALAELMQSDGTLKVEREQMAARVGMPRRTLEYQLHRLCELGWLVHISPGRKGVGRGTYGAADWRVDADSTQDPAPDSTQDPGSDSTQEMSALSTPEIARKTLRASSSLPTTTEQGGHDAGRTRQGAPDESASTSPTEGRSTGRGPDPQPDATDPLDDLTPTGPQAGAGPSSAQPTPPPAAGPAGDGSDVPTLPGSSSDHDDTAAAAPDRNDPPSRGPDATTERARESDDALSPLGRALRAQPIAIGARRRTREPA